MSSAHAPAKTPAHSMTARRTADAWKSDRHSPAPGTFLPVGGNITVSGVAYDTTATGSAGIDRVSVFLGDRDAGGTFWGDATLGQPSPQLGPDRASAGYSRRSPTLGSAST